MGCGPSEASDVKTQKNKQPSSSKGGSSINVPTSVSFDFHKVKYVDCEKFVEYALDNKPKTISNQKLTQIIFISGKGQHSKDGKPILKPMILEKCNSKGYKAQVDSNNEGQILVPVK